MNNLLYCLLKTNISVRYKLSKLKMTHFAHLYSKFTHNNYYFQFH